METIWLLHAIIDSSCKAETMIHLCLTKISFTQQFVIIDVYFINNLTDDTKIRDTM